MTEKLTKIVDELSTLTALEVAELTKMLEIKWGVTAAVATTAVATTTTVAEEKTDFTVTLESVGESKINVIKEIRAITGLGLKEAKDLVDSAPKIVKEDVQKADAEAMKAKLEAVGAKVKLS